MRRLMRVEVLVAPQPTLKAQLTRAPYWFALSTTDDAVCRVMQFWKVYVVCQLRAWMARNLTGLTLRSLWRRRSPLVCERGMGYGTSVHWGLAQRWP